MKALKCDPQQDLHQKPMDRGLSLLPLRHRADDEGRIGIYLNARYYG